MPTKPTYEELEQRVKELETLQRKADHSPQPLLEKELFYAGLFRNMQHEVHVWKLVFNDDGSIKTWKLVDANPVALQSWKRDLSEIVGKTADEIFPQSGATEFFMPIVQQIFESGEPHTWDAYFPGTDQNLHMTSIPIGDYFLSTGIDITDRIEAEETRVKILESSIGGIYIYDLGLGKNTYINKQYTALTGFTLDEISSMTSDEFFELFHPEDRSKISQHMQSMTEDVLDDHNLHVDYRFKHKNEGWRWFTSCDAVYERCENGEVKQFIGTFIDITENKQLEEQLRQAQKMEAIGTLAGGIAHDFNNILSVILGYTEMALDEIPPDSAAAKDLEEVFNGATRAKNLVNQILSFSRQSEIERIPLQPEIIIREAAKMLRSSLPTSIEIHQDINSTGAKVLADPTQIHQIVMNLCTNAFHAMEETGGLLTLSCNSVNLGEEDLRHEKNVSPGPFFRLSISDSGPGIPTTIQNDIFDPYFTTKEFGKGTGMGLAIVYGIVSGYGGFISLTSEPGEGTTFDIFLPIIERGIPSGTRGAGEIPRGTERILFIDDERPLTELAKIMLERLGYTVTVSNSSSDALQTFESQPDQFDLVITDQTMPDMNGAEIAGRMIQIRPDIPIVLCTGYSSVISEEKANSMGIRELVMKPISKGEIAHLIRKVLDSQ